MDKTLNFCGDSFCATADREWSWTTLLAEHFDARIVGLGKSGSAHEHAIKSFHPNADITVFCWTEKSRVYHPTHSINFSITNHGKLEDRVLKAGYAYYKYLYDEQYAQSRQYRDLFWFDHEILSQYAGKCIHLWCFEATYAFNHGYTHSEPLHNAARIYPPGETTRNHLNIEDNKKLFNAIIGEING